MILTKYSDPGHGWLKCPIHILEGLGIKDKITPSSYISKSGKYAYLEEDCDETLLENTLKAMNIDFVRKDIWTNNRSSIRMLDSYPYYKENI